MLSYYIIPNNVHYVQRVSEIETWVKTDKIYPNIATVVVIDDSKATHYARFVVVYKGLMQLQGGSGACYNPLIKTFIYNEDPMDNSKMPKHMSKWCTFNYITLLQMVISAKYSLLEKMGYRKQLPFWYWDCAGYNSNPGLLIGQLDLIGMGVAPPSIIKQANETRKQKLLA